jgi:hypothetical protein
LCLSSSFDNQSFLRLPPLHPSISALDGPFLFTLPDYWLYFFCDSLSVILTSRPVCLNPQITVYPWPNPLLYLLRHRPLSFTGQILWIRDQQE